MKKGLILMAAVILFAAPAMADIFNSKHNLGDNSGTGKATSVTGMSEVCIFCHAPHNPAQNVPLWNRNDPTAAVTFYTSGTINMAQKQAGAFSAGSVSKFCLSCHDGSLGMWAGVYNKFGKTGVTGDYAMTSSMAIGSAASSSLANDHPVNIIYTEASQDPDFKTKASAIAEGVRFFLEGGTDQVECASCHDPHKTTNGKFLRISNAGSALCLACHNK